jgi:hypothetical protein
MLSLSCARLTRRASTSSSVDAFSLFVSRARLPRWANGCSAPPVTCSSRSSASSLTPSSSRAAPRGPRTELFVKSMLRFSDCFAISDPSLIDCERCISPFPSAPSDGDGETRSASPRRGQTGPAPLSQMPSSSGPSSSRFECGSWVDPACQSGCGKGTTMDGRVGDLA